MVAVTNIFKDKEEKEKLTEVDLDNKHESFNVNDAKYLNPNVITTVQPQRSRACVRALCLLTCFLFGCFLLIGGVLLYKYFTTPKTWFDVCSVRYRRPEAGHLIDNGGLYADDLIDKPVFQPKEFNNFDLENEDNENGEFKQVMALNVTDQTERIEVPEISGYKEATFIHDFSVNWTAIFDKNENRCFLMPLDRSKIKPPRDMLDIILKTRQGYYLPDNILIHQFMVVQEPLTDLAPYGRSIQYRCKNKMSYLMKKREPIGSDHKIDKRDSKSNICGFASEFMHSSGQYTLVHHIEC